ncbi:PPC domain-containing protein [Adonisia turfae]|uniref:Peptidase C-terminal archaeal/bacterial domain-containing protein n=1 Tax=Adonisia turfae CCMR0081 TaxID=2292702 RepID=A0A6M0RYU4_9CYAN|nr:PPC domain-containing protein [Adonisia turfae]NEZ61053.1 hypothetical protein [Adonisia turfae CCMR0081]
MLDVEWPTTLNQIAQLATSGKSRRIFIPSYFYLFIPQQNHAFFYAFLTVGFLALSSIFSTSEKGLAQGTTILREQGRLKSSDNRLTDNSPYDIYRFNGNAGQQVTITLESSDFDTHLLLIDTVGNTISENDDVRNGITNSGLTVTLPENGEYVIVANTHQPSGQGRYVLTMTSDSAVASGQPTSQSSSSAGEGVIEGRLTYPSDYVPALRVCAQSTSNYYLLNCISTELDQTSFQLSVSPGEYYVFSYEKDTFRDADTNVMYDAFFYHANWEPNSNPIPVRVVAGETVSGISLENYSICRDRATTPSYCVVPPN